MPTEMELTLEQTQQGVSYEVSNIRVNSFTMKMEILLEPTSNKLMVEHAEYDESNTYVLERFNTTAGNPVKKILLKLNLSDHRLFKDGGGDFRYSDTARLSRRRLSRSDEVLKIKEIQERCNIKAFQVNKSRKVVKVEEFRHAGYNSLENIKMIREDGNTYVFSEADYKKLHLNDIEDLYLKKIHSIFEHLKVSIMDSLLIFIRRVVIKFRVEDLHLGLESYQKRLNIKKPKLTCPGIKEIGQYTLVKETHRVYGVYE
ncbi:hypothetical protein Tco_1220465 [Tanacetum coccineum]